MKLSRRARPARFAHPMNARTFLRSLALLAAIISPTMAAPSLTPIELRCEFRANPVGLGETQPRLSWKLAARDFAARGLRQTAWQVLVASSAESLAADRGDCWDSGKVVTDATNNLAYAGRALKSRDVCF